MPPRTKKQDTMDLLMFNANAIMQDRKAVTDKLKVTLIQAIKDFFNEHKNLVSELYFIQRTSEYDDNGSTLSTGSMNFKPTDVLKYLLGVQASQIFIEDADEDRERFEEFNSLNWELKHEDKAKKLFSQHRVPPQAQACLRSLAKLSVLLETLPDAVIGEMFGENKAVFITSEGTIDIQHFDPWSYS